MYLNGKKDKRKRKGSLMIDLWNGNKQDVNIFFVVAVINASHKIAL